MYKEKLVAKQDYEQKKADYESAAGQRERKRGTPVAGRSRSVRRPLAQLDLRSKAGRAGAGGLTRLSNVLARFDVVAPLDGVVTNLPVRVGETVVPGVQNSAAITIMTIADMSLITAEVKVDETDIVNVQLGQAAEITIDAMPNKTFTGHVIEIGNTAILRSTGLAASQSATSSQEAKDFKVVVAMDDPPDEIRPGPVLHRQNHHRHAAERAGDSDSGADGAHQGRPGRPARRPASTGGRQLDPAAGEGAQGRGAGRLRGEQGDKAEFRKVETGITGATDIEVLSGLKEGDQIVTGSYKVIRTHAQRGAGEGRQQATGRRTAKT